MQNLHDDNRMDDLSRQAAEAYQPDQDLHSWESLRPKLEAALPQKKERKRRFLIVFLLFLLIGGGIVSSTIWNKTRPSSSNTSVAPDQAKTAKPTKQKTSTTAQTQPNTTAITTTTPVKVDEPAAIVQSNKTTLSLSNKNKTGRPAQSSTSTNRKNNDVANNITTTENPQTIILDEDHIVPSPVRKGSLAQQIKIQFAQAPLLPEPASAKKDKAKQSTPLKNRWEFGLVYAPDVSTVRFTHTQKPGTNVGLTVAYNISKRFAIQAGALYTTKNYKSYGKDYHPPKGYWTDYVDLKTVTADCNMWDIPVNLRYNLAPRKSSNLFASAGLSSYLMKEENYNYFYYYNGNPVNRERSYYTDNRHWMSVLNLSVGYERQLSKNIAIQAEPFFKQPLKGLGFGSVKLNSTGIYFSVKYKPLTAAGRQANKLR